jgi:hypothetical protein
VVAGLAGVAAAAGGVGAAFLHDSRDRDNGTATRIVKMRFIKIPS